jgi:hypothetical protein
MVSNVPSTTSSPLTPALPQRPIACIEGLVLQMAKKKRKKIVFTFEKGCQRSLYSRLPGTNMNRQQTAASTTTNMPRRVSDRWVSVFLTKGSRIRLKSIKVYSLYPTRARMGSSMYWCVKMR